MGKDDKYKTEGKSIAEKNYEPLDNSNDELSKGLAITHEQISDVYMEGTVDGSIDQVNDNGQVTSEQGEKIKREGYDE